MNLPETGHRTNLVFSSKEGHCFIYDFREKSYTPGKFRAKVPLDIIHFNTILKQWRETHLREVRCTSVNP